MNEPVEIFLGFDPGGKDAFGWCVCQSRAGEFALVDTDVASYADEAVKQVLNSESLPTNYRVLAVGIDSPMFWNITGEKRKVDGKIREAVRRARVIQRQREQEIGRFPRLMEVNSLPGAVLVQGILLGASLYQRFRAPITEAYPGALRCLLEACHDNKSLPPELEDHKAKLKRSPIDKDNHEWDALAAAYAAWCMHRQAPGWRDLFSEEPDPVLPLGTPVSYWMPIP